MAFNSDQPVTRVFPASPGVGVLRTPGRLVLSSDATGYNEGEVVFARLEAKIFVFSPNGTTAAWAWREVTPTDGGGYEVQTGMREGDAGGKNPAFELGGKHTFEVGDVVLLRPWTYSSVNGLEWLIVGTPPREAAKPDTFLACLVAKCYWYGTLGSEFCTEDPECDGGTPSQPKPRRYVQYSWIEVLDSGAEPGPPCPITYEWGSRCGGPGCLPAYHVANLDLPVWPLAASPSQPCCGNATEPPEVPVQPHSVVRLRRSGQAVTKSIGPNFPLSAADDDAVGAVAWSGPGNVTASDDAYATAALGALQQSHYLKLTDFGFALPPLATVKGVEVSCEVSQTPAAAPQGVREAVVALVVGGLVAGANKADLVTPWPSSDAVITRGGAADLWGLSGLSGEDVNAADFGVVISVANDDANAHTARVDRVTVTVHYETGEYYLIDTPPWSDLFRRTGQIDQETGLEIAYHRYWDQNLAAYLDGQEVRIRPAG